MWQAQVWTKKSSKKTRTTSARQILAGTPCGNRLARHNRPIGWCKTCPVRKRSFVAGLWGQITQVGYVTVFNNCWILVVWTPTRPPLVWDQHQTFHRSREVQMSKNCGRRMNNLGAVFIFHSAMLFLTKQVIIWLMTKKRWNLFTKQTYHGESSEMHVFHHHHLRSWWATLPQSLCALKNGSSKALVGRLSCQTNPPIRSLCWLHPFSWIQHAALADLF